GYHIIQSQIAIGQGGLFGRGLFNGSQTHGNFLPIQETDFIFSVVGEELGFVGAVCLLFLFFVLIYRCIFIAINAKDNFGFLLAVGVVSMLTFHVLVNVGMTAGIMPVTGIPLPMFSYGGSNMITNLAALGILLNINMRRQKIVF
ncbi:MAG TPA: rod shape-determining protein RodA, partial [Pelotomaculum sp.]|nr:rod shape-determining protein RodA [Pelotomaculum sp.]